MRHGEWTAALRYDAVIEANSASTDDAAAARFPAQVRRCKVYDLYAHASATTTRTSPPHDVNLAFTRSGALLASSAHAECLFLLHPIAPDRADAHGELRAPRVSAFPVKKYGVGPVLVLNSSSTSATSDSRVDSVLHASNNPYDHTLRLLQLTRASGSASSAGAYTRYFRAHRDFVSDLAVCDLGQGGTAIVSASMDGTARLWDTRLSAPVGRIMLACVGVSYKLIATPPAAADAAELSSGAFAVAFVPPPSSDFAQKNEVRVAWYDARMFDRGPLVARAIDVFRAANQRPAVSVRVACAELSSDGQELLLGVENGVFTRGFSAQQDDVALFDAVALAPRTERSTSMPNSKHFADVCARSVSISPCGTYICGGTQSGRVWVRERADPARVVLDRDAHQQGPISSVKFHPSCELLVSAAREIALWTVPVLHRNALDDV